MLLQNVDLRTHPRKWRNSATVCYYVVCVFLFYPWWERCCSRKICSYISCMCVTVILPCTCDELSIVLLTVTQLVIEEYCFLMHMFSKLYVIYKFVKYLDWAYKIYIGIRKLCFWDHVNVSNIILISLDAVTGAFP